MKQVVLKNDLVKIRPITVEDTDLIVDWRNSPQVYKNFIYQVKFSKESHQNWLDRNVFAGKAAQFIIEDIASGKPVGSVYLRDIDPQHQKAEYGIFLGECYGSGFGTAATRLILQYGFEELHLHKIFLRVFAENTVAIKTYKKVGFVQEGYFRDDVKINGEFKDIIFMSIVAGKEDLS